MNTGEREIMFSRKYYVEKRAEIMMVQLFPEAWMNVQWWKQHQKEVERRRWNACQPQHVPMALDCHKLPPWRDTVQAEMAVFRNPGNGGHPAKNSWDRWTIQQRRMFLDCSLGIRTLTEYERERIFGREGMEAHQNDHIMRTLWKAEIRPQVVADMSGQSRQDMAQIADACARAQQRLE